MEGRIKKMEPPRFHHKCHIIVKPRRQERWGLRLEAKEGGGVEGWMMVA